MTALRPATLWLFATLAFLIAVVAYALGFGWIVISETDEKCSQEIIVHEGAHYLHMRNGLLPLERSCVFDDGSTYEDVPGWVNPVFFGGLAATAGFAVAGIGVTVRRRRRPEPA